MNNKPDPETEQWVIQVDCKELDCARSIVSFNADKVFSFNYSRKENYYHTVSRLRKLIPDEPGALVLNDFLEMWMLDNYPVQQTVYQLIHDPYYVRLAEKHHHVVDVFITHNKSLFDDLNKKLPHRKEDIFFLPHGVTIPHFFRDFSIQGNDNTVRLLFLARIVESKGIYDLIEISDLLQQAGCRFEWTIMGRGPELPELKNRWNRNVPVNFISPDTNEEVLEIAARQDIFVLPTKFDGTPVSLLETMSVGLVPVVTDLPGGIHEIVKSDIGFALPMNDNAAFAAAIIKLYHDRDLLGQLSKKAREKAEQKFDVKKTTLAYFEKFSQFQDSFTPKTLKKEPLGSRLDHPLIPSFITRALRSFKH
jgi:glycosyltransferase involved in cell wall biosynthesis